MTTVLVTGGAGFIGSNLAKRCLDEGWTVEVVDDLSNGHAVFVPKGAKFVRNDFSAPMVLGWVRAKRYDYVFHLAAVPRVSYSVEHPVETNDTNVSKSLKLIEACKGNIKRFIFASSSSVYGLAETIPTSEMVAKNPTSPYALQKSIVEDYLKMYHEYYKLDSACMRFFNVFGPNCLGDSAYATAVSAWLSAIKKGKPMRSDGDGSQSRDMCYVDNVADACVKAAQHVGDLGADRFNVACGERTTNAEILQFLQKRYPEAQVQHAPWRPGDVRHTCADVSKAGRILGYKPLVHFWDGLERTIEWVEKTPAFTKLKLNT